MRTTLSRRLGLVEGLSHTEQVVRLTSVFRRMLGFTATVVTGVSFEEVGVVVGVRPRWRHPRCGECGRRAPGYDEGEPRMWRHLALGRMQLWLRYTPRRVSCGR